MGRINCAAVAVIACSLAFAASASASGEFEPNDTFNTAAGPIQAGVDISATYETVNDEDYYFFYLPQQTQLRYTLRNSTSAPYRICLDLYQQTPSSVDYIDDGFLSVNSGQTGSNAISLGPGKYYMVMTCSGTIGKTYTLHLDPPGVTSDYTPFAVACANAHPAVVAAADALSKAQLKLARAKAKHRHRAVSKYRGQVRAAKDSYAAATQTEAQACSVPQ